MENNIEGGDVIHYEGVLFIGISARTTIDACRELEKALENMNINMKYYIVTIGSIFLALGIGIIVGFNLNYDQELSKQQSEVLSEFEDRFDSLNQEKADLNTQIEDLTKEQEKLTSYISQNYNLLITNALTDRNTGIIITNEKNDYSEEIENLIKDADGHLAFNIVVRDTIEDEKKLKTL